MNYLGMGELGTSVPPRGPLFMTSSVMFLDFFIAEFQVSSHQRRRCSCPRLISCMRVSGTCLRSLQHEQCVSAHIAKGGKRGVLALASAETFLVKSKKGD